MAAIEFDIKIEKRATFRLEIDGAELDDVPLDLSSWAFSGQLRRPWNNAVVAAEFSFDTDRAASGVVTAILTKEVTAGIPVDEPDPADDPTCQRALTDYIYDIYGTDGDGVATRLLEGCARVSPSVTRGA